MSDDTIREIEEALSQERFTDMVTLVHWIRYIPGGPLSRDE